MKVLVVGGTRFIGLAVVKALLARGHQVAVFNRGRNLAVLPAGVEVLLGDRNEEADVAPLQSRTFDTVVDTSAYHPRQTELMLRALRGRVGRVIHLSSGAVFAEPERFPIDEDAPRGEWPLWGTYGRDKRRCEEVLEEAAREAQVEVSAVRAPWVYGPGDYTRRASFLFARILRREPILVPGAGRSPLQLLYVDDLADAVARLVEYPGRLEARYNAGDDSSPTLCGLIRLAGRLAGVEPLVVHVELTAHGIPEEPYDLQDAVLPFPDRPYVLRTERLKSTVGASFRPNEEGLAACLAWFLEDPEARTPYPTPREQAVRATLGFAPSFGGGVG